MKITPKSPSFITKLFGKKEIAFYDNVLYCFIKFRNTLYLVKEVYPIDGNYFQIPKGYSLKKFIPNPEHLFK